MSSRVHAAGCARSNLLEGSNNPPAFCSSSDCLAASCAAKRLTPGLVFDAAEGPVLTCLRFFDGLKGYPFAVASSSNLQFSSSIQEAIFYHLFESNVEQKKMASEFRTKKPFQRLLYYFSNSLGLPGLENPSSP
jgi:hypothetical protein